VICSVDFHDLIAGASPQEVNRDPNRTRQARGGACKMPVGIRPAIPAASPRTVAVRSGRDRLLRWLSGAITSLCAAVAILVVAMVAVVLGIT
jgi:hypothetical protein